MKYGIKCLTYNTYLNNRDLHLFDGVLCGTWNMYNKTHVKLTVARHYLLMIRRQNINRQSDFIII